MLKLIKYNLKNDMKELLIVFSIFFITAAVVALKFNEWPDSLLGLLIVGAFTFALIGTFITNLRQFSSYIYGDKSPLILTLPQTGFSLVGSLLLTSLLELLLVGVIGAIISIYILLIAGVSWMPLRGVMLGTAMPAILSLLITICASVIGGWILSLLTFYFSLVLGRGLVRNKVFGWLLVVISFVGVSSLSSLPDRLMVIWPYTVSLSIPFPMFVTDATQSAAQISIQMGEIFTIAPLVLAAKILVAFVLFWATSYLVENKVEVCE